MSSNLAPLIVGIVAAGLLLTLIGIAPSRRPVERIRLNRRSRRSEDEATSEEWIYLPRAPREEPAEPSRPTAETDVGVGANLGAQGHSGHRGCRAWGSELLLAAEKQREALAARTRRMRSHCKRGTAQARELLEEAELEAKRIVVAAGRELARKENELEQERAALARWTTLDSVSTVQEAARKAEELRANTELQCADFVREAQAEAERKATEIAKDAEQRARSGWRKPKSRPRASS